MKTKSQPAGTERSAKIKNVIRVSSGNLLERCRLRQCLV